MKFDELALDLARQSRSSEVLFPEPTRVLLQVVMTLNGAQLD